MSCLREFCVMLMESVLVCVVAGKLLKWHAALVKKGGIGSVVRAFADRQNV